MYLLFKDTQVDDRTRDELVGQINDPTELLAILGGVSALPANHLLEVEVSIRAKFRPPKPGSDLKKKDFEENFLLVHTGFEQVPVLRSQYAEPEEPKSKPEPPKKERAFVGPDNLTFGPVPKRMVDAIEDPDDEPAPEEISFPAIEEPSGELIVLPSDHPVRTQTIDGRTAWHILQEAGIKTWAQIPEDYAQIALLHGMTYAHLKLVADMVNKKFGHARWYRMQRDEIEATRAEFLTRPRASKMKPEDFWRRQGLTPRQTRLLRRQLIYSFEDLKTTSDGKLKLEPEEVAYQIRKALAVVTRRAGHLLSGQWEDYPLHGKKIQDSGQTAPKPTDYWLSRGMSLYSARQMAKHGIKTLGHVPALSQFKALRGVGSVTVKEVRELAEREEAELHPSWSKDKKPTARQRGIRI